MTAGPLTKSPPPTTLAASFGALVLGAGWLAATLLLGLMALSVVHGEPASLAGGGNGVSAVAQQQIPAVYLRFYRQAAERYGLDWAILAGIGRVECDHGRDPDPACTREGAVNSAGAGGPMQFLASTWARYGVDADGDGRVDRWDPADAIFGAARYLRASGAPADYRRAIFAYNHAGWYVAAVERWAALYRGSEGGEDASLSAADRRGSEGGGRAVLSATDGHLALIPTAAPAVVQAMIVAGNELQGLPYGTAGHPDPRGALSEDCSSTVNYVLYRSGVRPIGEIVRSNPLAQDYVNWGLPGPGRWVSIYATTSPSDHVFMVIAGLRLDTSHNGTDVGPNRFEAGPRWRVLDHIPTWAHWSVRHPPGL
ncbi:MAG TPA: lytic transglycosylase domain-containing protein [Solirubrobacteraceae bacterium]|jgi:hypothetical protein